uniref:Uncharacterized protein n=1 Tax=viral metagenome TaxID=1070528 RepID=A0A6C0JHR7_9ZZZZ
MAPVTILVVDKAGTIKEVSLKSYDENELYKKAGLKTAEGFKCYAEWNIEDLNDKSYCVSVFGKITGKANQENKFDFPPPIDNTLFFGSCIIVNKKNEKATSITVDEWDSVYDYLFGGFEELGDEDSEEEEDDDEDDGLPRTKDGYVKDDFVVDDDEEEEDEEEEEEEEDDDEEEEVYVKKVKSNKKPKNAEKGKPDKKNKKNTVIANVFTSINQEETYLDCTSELSEEEYV